MSQKRITPFLLILRPSSVPHPELKLRGGASAKRVRANAPTRAYHLATRLMAGKACWNRHARAYCASIVTSCPVNSIGRLSVAYPPLLGSVW